LTHLQELEAEVSSWPGISTQPHRFGGTEFRFGSGEVGHIHVGGTVDIPFPKSIHDALLAEGLAEQYRWVPNSGWMTFQISREEDVQHALWLMKLSYLRHKMKTASEPRSLLENESQRLRLTPKLKSLIIQLLPVTPERHSTPVHQTGYGQLSRAHKGRTDVCSRQGRSY
jgi:Family of unknown function (DUF5519)